MKKYIIILILFCNTIIFAQENLAGRYGYNEKIIDTTIVRLQKELMKIDHFGYRNYMKQIIIIDEANRLVKNPYSLINRFLDFKNYRQNQLEDKNI